MTTTVTSARDRETDRAILGVCESFEQCLYLERKVARREMTPQEAQEYRRVYCEDNPDGCQIEGSWGARN